MSHTHSRPARMDGWARSFACLAVVPTILATVWLVVVCLAAMAPTLAHGTKLGSYDLLSVMGLGVVRGATVHNVVSSDQIQQFAARGRTSPGKPSTAVTCRSGIPSTPWAHHWPSTCSRPRSVCRCSWPISCPSASPTPRSYWSRSSWPAPACCSSAGSWASGPWPAPSPGRCSN